MGTPKDDKDKPPEKRRGRQPRPEVTGKTTFRRCDTCKGSGKLDRKTCGACAGKGGVDLRSL